MGPRIKFLGPDDSLRTVYRNILKACARHPDAFVGEWWACRMRGKLRALVEKERTPAEMFAKTTMARQVLGKLQRSAQGDKDAFDFVVNRAYGGTGAGRWKLLQPFTSPKVLPPAISILRDRPTKTLPTYSPFLVTAADSPHFLAAPRPPLRLAFPDTLPDHGRPGNPELVVRQFLEPSRETNIRRQYFNAMLERMKVPVAVRVVGLQEEGDSDPVDVTKQLAALGIDWAEFADGRRELFLDRLERLAGKGSTHVSPPTSPRTPIEQINLSSPPFGPPSSSSTSALTKAQPPYPIPQTIHHSSLPPAHYPDAYQDTYRNLLSNFPILTVDLSRTAPPNEWLSIQFSAWSTNGPAYYRPADPTDDLPFLRPSEEGEATAEDLFDFPPFEYKHSIALPAAGSLEADKSAAIVARKAAKKIAVEAEAQRRIQVVKERLGQRGLTSDQIDWEMVGKWEAGQGEQPGATEQPQQGQDLVEASQRRREKRAKERAARRVVQASP